MSDLPRVWPFFALTLLWSWGLQWPAVLFPDVEALMGLAALGGFGPLIAAIVMSRRDGFALFAQLRRWPAPWFWYLFALLLPGALLALGCAAATPMFGDRAWFYPPNSGQAWVALFVVSFVEEMGWRGYALPRMQETHGALKASLAIGAVWAAWHLPMLVLQGLDPVQILATVPYFVAGSVVFTWLFNAHRAGLPAAILAHMGAHLNNSHQALPDDPVPAFAHVLLFVLFAIVLAVRSPDLGQSSNPTNDSV